MVDRRIRAARFPAVKSLDTFDFLAIPSVNKALVTELARFEYVERRENVIAVGIAAPARPTSPCALRQAQQGLAACQRGMSVGFATAAALVHMLVEARDERRLLNLQRQLSRLNLLIIDELGFVPLFRTGAELLFEIFSQRYERGSTMVTTNLPFGEWTEVFGSERLTGALLGRLTHHVHILEMNGESYRLKRSREHALPQAPTTQTKPKDTLNKSGDGFFGGCRGGFAEFPCFRGRFPEPSGLPFRSNGPLVGFDRPGRRPVSAFGPTAPASPGQLTLRCQQVAQAQQQRQTLRVIRQTTPVANLGVAEPPLHFQEQVLHPRSQSRAGSWPSPTPCASLPTPHHFRIPVSAVTPDA